MSRLLLIFTVSIFVASCGGGGSADSSSAQPVSAASAPVQNSIASVSRIEADTAMQKTWLLQSGAFLLIGDSRISYLALDPVRQCLGVEHQDYLPLSDQAIEFVLEDMGNSVFDLHQGEPQLRIADNQVFEARDGQANLLNMSNQMPLCQAAQSGSLRAAVRLVEPPSRVRIDRRQSETLSTELSWSVRFDLNGSGSIDTGDLILRLSNTKYANENEAIVDLQSVQSQLLLVTSHDVAFPLPQPVEVSLTAETLSFYLEQLHNPLAQSISEDTPLLFEAEVFYLNPEADLMWQGTSDGPWNWSQSFHRDQFPDRENNKRVFMPAYLLNGKTDAANDVEGQSHWVDILSLSLDLSE